CASTRPRAARRARAGSTTCAAPRATSPATLPASDGRDTRARVCAAAPSGRVHGVAPRSIWNGAIAFGAVTVPVKVYGALEDRSIRFRELHAKDGSEVAHVLVGPDGAEIPRERVARGFEVAPDEYVVLTNDEIKAADQPARKAIELEDFVPADQID